MSFTLRQTFNSEVADLVRYLNAREQQGRCLTFASIGNGSTNGKIRTNAAITYRVAGQLYTKSSTDDLWDLSALTTLGASDFKAVILFLDSSGTASITACTAKSSILLAAAEVEGNLHASKAVVGVYIAGNSTNFANALAAQGTLYNGLPEACFAKNPVTSGLYDNSESRAGVITLSAV